MSCGGRRRGSGCLRASLAASSCRRSTTSIFRFVDYPGEPRPFYLKRAAQLDRVLENAGDGDIVGLVRGRDKDIGKPNPMQTWEGWTRPCDEPLGLSSTGDEPLAF